MKKILFICVAIMASLVISGCGGTPKCDSNKVVEIVKDNLSYVTANDVATNMIAEHGGVFPLNDTLEQWAKEDIKVNVEGIENLNETCKANVAISSSKFKLNDNGTIQYKVDSAKDSKDGIKITFTETKFKKLNIEYHLEALEYRYIDS